MSALIPREPCASNLALDRRLSGELSAEAQRQLDDHLLACVRCRVCYEALARQRTGFLERAPDWNSFAALQRGVAHGRRSWLRGSVAGGLAASALLALMLLRSPDHEPSSALRSKGSPSIGFYIKRGELVLPGASGDSVKPGDQLRFTYSSDRGAFFALLDVDMSATSIYYPLTATTEFVEAGRDRPLDFGIELDEQLGTERVFGLFCESPLALEPVRVALQARGQLPALPGCQSDVVTLYKLAP